jgi:hypothetical protein
MITTSSRRTRLGENARRRATEAYDWEAICEAMSRIYQDARDAASDRQALAPVSSVAALPRGSRS